VQEQEAMIAQLEKQIKAMNAGLQRMSAQIALNKPTSQTV
jgi:hypothetical protein